MTKLRLDLFGALNIKLGEKRIKGLKTKKARAILVFLVVEANRSHNRSILAEFFWPDKPEGTARNSLKQALSNLRKSLGDRETGSPFLLIDRDEIQFNSGSDFWVDTNEFTRLIEESKSHRHRGIENCLPCSERLEKAANLYQGDFLSGFSLPDSAAFEEWVITNREAYQRQMSDVYRNLIEYEKQNEDYLKACQYAKQLVVLEPWNEENHREIIALLAKNGRRSESLRQFQTCLEMLEKELGVKPSEETTKLYEQIRDGQYKQAQTDSLAKDEQSHQPKNRLAILPILVPMILVIGILGFSLLTGSRNTTASQYFVDVEESSNAIENAADKDQIISEEEQQVLIILYLEMGGADWNNLDGWLTDSKPCYWFGIVCSGGLVAEIDLSHNNLSGNIPSEMGDLNNLKSLKLFGNSQLSGPIPPELGKLANLEIMILSNYEGGTQLNGSIPSELGNLEKLRWLEISNSLVSGSIPPALGELTNLTLLDLSNNPLSGSLPPEIGNLVNLQILAFGEGRNELNGALPTSLINLTKLRAFQFNETDLCEPPSLEFQAWLNNIEEVYRTDVLCPVDN